jgi:hypothetical protein
VDRILDLPYHAQVFLHQKGFSLKEMINLLHHSKDAFQQLLSDDQFFHFTKRTFDEALSFIAALIKRHSISLSDLFNQTQYVELKSKNITPQQRLKQWLNILKQQMSPVLLGRQKKIDAMILDISLPAEVSYDRTLEHAGITIQSTFQNLDDLVSFSSSISNKGTQKKIQEVMELI